MNDHVAPPRRGGFTLIELMVTVAVITILLMIAAPSFKQLIAQQRLKNINAELVSTLQFARSEAIARNTPIFLKFVSSVSPPMTCYIAYTPQNAQCDCTGTPGNACTSGTELRAVQIPSSTDVRVTGSVTSGFTTSFFNADGVLSNPTGSMIAKAKRISAAPGCLQTSVNGVGRPSVCSPDNSVPGVPQCSPAATC
jgi:type IV fimbrial biogenesis protein FimT